MSPAELQAPPPRPVFCRPPHARCPPPSGPPSKTSMTPVPSEYSAPRCARHHVRSAARESPSHGAGDSPRSRRSHVRPQTQAHPGPWGVREEALHGCSNAVDDRTQIPRLKFTRPPNLVQRGENGPALRMTEHDDQSCAESFCGNSTRSATAPRFLQTLECLARRDVQQPSRGPMTRRPA